MTPSQDNAYIIHRYMTSLPENAYRVVYILGNAKRVLMTDHQHATDHRHLPITIQDVTIERIITAEIITDLHHRSVIVVKDLRDVKTLHNTIA